MLLYSIVPFQPRIKILSATHNAVHLIDKLLGLRMYTVVHLPKEEIIKQCEQTSLSEPEVNKKL